MPAALYLYITNKKLCKQLHYCRNGLNCPQLVRRHWSINMEYSTITTILQNGKQPLKENRCFSSNSPQKWNEEELQYSVLHKGFRSSFSVLFSFQGRDPPHPTVFSSKGESPTWAWLHFFSLSLSTSLPSLKSYRSLPTLASCFVACLQKEIAMKKKNIVNVSTLNLFFMKVIIFQCNLHI